MSIPHKYQLLILADHIKNRGNIWRWLVTPSWRRGGWL